MTPFLIIAKEVLTAPILTIILGGKFSPKTRDRTVAKISVSIELIVKPAIVIIFWYLVTNVVGAPTIRTTILSVETGFAGLSKTFHVKVTLVKGTGIYCSASQ